jgi:hypothetical protein
MKEFVSCKSGEHSNFSMGGSIQWITLERISNLIKPRRVSTSRRADLITKFITTEASRKRAMVTLSET